MPFAVVCYILRNRSYACLPAVNYPEIPGFRQALWLVNYDVPQPNGHEAALHIQYWYCVHIRVGAQAKLNVRSEE